MEKQNKIVFEDGTEGYYLKDYQKLNEELTNFYGCEALLGIITKDNLLSIAFIHVDLNHQFYSSDFVLDKMYKEINIIPAIDREKHFYSNWGLPGKLCAYCTLPNGKKELYQFQANKFYSIFTESDNVESCKQVYFCPAYQKYEMYYLLHHCDKTVSIASKNLLFFNDEATPFKYIIKNAKNIEFLENTFLNKVVKVTDEPTETEMISYTYDIVNNQKTEISAQPKPVQGWGN